MAAFCVGHNRVSAFHLSSLMCFSPQAASERNEQKHDVYVGRSVVLHRHPQFGS